MACYWLEGLPLPGTSFFQDPAEAALGLLKDLKRADLELREVRKGLPWRLLEKRPETCLAQLPSGSAITRRYHVVLSI